MSGARVLTSFLAGRFRAGTGEGRPVVDPVTEEVLARASSEGLDVEEGLAHARNAGGPALRALSFPERGALLARLAERIHASRDDLIELAMRNGGNTRSDAKFDVDGGALALQHYAEAAARLPERGPLPDGEPVEIGASKRLGGRHVRLPLPGVAVLVGAYNFPVWGVLEKAACAWLAGVPVVVKPATPTALVAHRLVEVLVEDGALPDGALSLLVGDARPLLAALDERDAVAFTGSSATAAALRALPNVRERSVRLNVEADSLNAALLLPDIEPGSDTFDLFVSDCVREMTQKAGQKCTALRRLFVPRGRVEAVREALAERIAEVRTGDPFEETVRMGPLASEEALESVRSGLSRLEESARVVARGSADFVRGRGAPDRGLFHEPVLLEAGSADTPGAVHEVEVFGPVQTLLPYGELDEAFAGVALGGGSLVTAVYGDDREALAVSVERLGPHTGRLYLGTRHLAGRSPGPGTALPTLVHGGPGRAGDGLELGDLRGLWLYTRLVALEGYAPLLGRLSEPRK